MNKTARLPKVLLAACAVAAAALASSPASAEPIFTVQEGVIDGSLPQFVTADRITFGYTAKIIQTIGGGSLTGSDDPFVENGFLSKGSFELGAGNAVASQLNANVLAFGYGIYGVFKITGEADPGATPGTIHATFQTATLTLFADPNQDTTKGFDAFNEVLLGNTVDDKALANLSLIVGEANVKGGLANGDFDSFLNFVLTPFGQTFFVSPNPFFGIENFGGNTQTITGADPTLSNNFVADATGAGVELFLAVPEPATLSIVGLALLGMGAVTRRQKKKS